jgi:hypothetical protein
MSITRSILCLLGLANITMGMNGYLNGCMGNTDPGYNARRGTYDPRYQIGGVDGVPVLDYQNPTNNRSIQHAGPNARRVWDRSAEVRHICEGVVTARLAAMRAAGQG